MDYREDGKMNVVLDNEVKERKTAAKEINLKEEGIKFEEKYGKFLAELKGMPKNTKDDKEANEARWKFFQSYPAKEQFIVDVWLASHPKAYERFCKQSEENYDTSLGQDAGIASYKNKNKYKKNEKEIDPTLFQMAIKGAIETYTGRTKTGKEYVFIACVGQIYRQLAGDEAQKNAFEEREGVTRSRSNRRELGRFIKAVRKICEERYTQDMESAEAVKEAVNYVLDGPLKYTISKADKDFVIRYIMGENSLLSLEEEINREENRTWGDVVTDESEDKDDYQAVMDRLVPFLQDVEDNWEDLKAFENLTVRMICKMFLTKDVLQVLKTDEKGQPYTEEPAGNEAAYRHFKPQGRFLYEKVFYEKYLCRAFVEKPMDFYETCVKVLRRDFDFSDKLLAEVEGKDKGTISKNRKIYRKCMLFFW